MEGQALKGYLDMLVLAAVGSGGARHGYAIIERLRELSRGEFDLPEGTVYPVLHRLEERGLLASRWTDEPRARRVYSMTSAGRRFLGEQRASWADFSAAVRAVLRMTT